MRTSIWKLTTAMILGILSFSSCSDDSESVLLEELQISLDKNELKLEIGQSERLVAGFSPSDATNKAHTWTSENPKIATVDETGNVKGISIGTTKITATALANKATATCIVEVVDKIIAVTSITLNSKDETLCVGATTQLTATINPTNATEKNVVWTSSDNAVATVDDNGLVKGVTVGSANITATVGGKSAVCAITVMEKSVDFSGIEYIMQLEGSLRIKGTIKTIGVNISEIGICFSTETAPTVETNKHILSTSGLTIDTEITDLTPNSYYARMYAIEGASIYYGKTVDIQILEEFTSQFKLIESYYDEYDGAKNYSLKLRSPSPKAKGFISGVGYCYGVAPNPEITDNIAEFATGDEYDTVWLKNLSGTKKYYVRAWTEQNRKPIYFPGEASFSTIGYDTKLNAVFLSSSYRYSSPWIYKINYTLCEKGTYKVSLGEEYVYKISIGKTSEVINSQILYVSDGSGNIYLSLTPWKSSTQYDWNGCALIIFENIDSGTVYKIRVGENGKIY